MNANPALTDASSFNVASCFSDANTAPSIDDRLAILGHEIRNPLSALSFALEAWPSTKDDPQLADDLLKLMRRQVTQLTRLCNDLLDAGKIAQGKLSICRCALSVGQVVQDACEEIRPFIAQRGLTMTVSIAGAPLSLLGDESKLTQVFANLLHNAAKFTDRNGHLQISLEKDCDTAVVILRDNGCGMCVDQVQAVFRPPTASVNRSRRPGGGLGIGLRLAKSIVELHGGSIEAFSKGTGRGSTFVVRLPLADATSRSSAYMV